MKQLTGHEKKVALFLTAIATGHLSVNKLKRFVADLKQAPCPTQKTRGTIKAAEEALARHESAVRSRYAQRNN